jgi:hypothetical protein
MLLLAGMPVPMSRNRRRPASAVRYLMARARNARLAGAAGTCLVVLSGLMVPTGVMMFFAGRTMGKFRVMGKIRGDHRPPELPQSLDLPHKVRLLEFRS